MKNELYKTKSVDELTFTDNGMFQAVLHEPDICAELVERLLNIRVKNVDYPELEKQIAPYYSSKGVRLDVYLKDEDKVIDVEIQSYPMEALGKRTRYYQSMIDIDCLMKGQDYTELKDSYILFICKQDPFKDKKNIQYGMPCYTFKNLCLENNEVNLNDKSLKVIYNASAYEKAEDVRIRNFLHFIHTNEPGEDDFSSKLSALVEKIKENDKFRRDYAGMNLHDRDLIRAASQEKAEEIAIELIKEGDSPEKISRCIGLSLEKVLELQEQIKVQA